ncbi:putative Coenzyme PQQ synthesis protein F [Pseudomonas sp. 8AS]|uniref:pyrroloquinoline quinone biosynthesis protein PqqF n=1 Tax=Pseudomonas sp. 8AS TaxID=2653163 RepID=UPI0012F07EC1|nr:pyrroloquinoline quinone biosynthesis protein PqqF [Pseudomonas sp. 8AS]VXC34633.1 putative Coenzyme PQQ synthesis protein F [Pseudomonas sp. 8AS]
MLAPGQQLHRQEFGPGLELLWLHAPDSLQAALALELDGGSHAEPAAYPGLAHFLEHLVFRGSQGFAGDDGLMGFVQRHAGQVNASTLGTHTLFHFQLPEAALSGACARLVDQLLQPLLEPAAQQAEREVLEAEFRLRSADPETLVEAAIGQALNPGHAAAGFHAGHRASLPLEQPAFQQALRDYQQAIYGDGFIRLVLVSRQAPDLGLPALGPLLQRLAAGRQALRRPAPVPLQLDCARELHLSLPGSAPRYQLVLALEQQGRGVPLLLELLQLALEHNAPGSLLGELQVAGLCSAVQVRLAHAQGEQALLLFDCHLLPGGAARRGQIRQLLGDWLLLFAPRLVDEAALSRWRTIRRQRWPLLGALEQARQLLEAPLDDLDSARSSLQALCAAWRAQRCLALLLDARPLPMSVTTGFALALAEERAPACPALPAAFAESVWPAQLPALAALPAAAWTGAGQQPSWSAPELAGLCLLWPGAAPGASGLRQLQERLQPLQHQAWQAGVRLVLQPCGTALGLRLLGLAGVLPVVLAEALALLRQPWPTAADGGAEPLGGIALRQLLQRLPEHLHGAAAGEGGALPDTAAGLLLSHDPALAGQLAAVCTQAGLRLGAEPALQPGVERAPRWQQVRLPGSECALLLFVPEPADVLGQAAWRVLGQCLPAAFQQRLRDEQALGYALFCGYRQFSGQAGLLFAVQSATASAPAIWQALQDFIAQQAQRLAALAPADWQAPLALTLEQLQSPGASLDEALEVRCQAWLAGQLEARLDLALQQLSPAELGDRLAALLATQPWLVLSNAEQP